MQRILVVMGTRPDVVKLAPVVHALRRADDRFDTRVLFTSQHRDLAASMIEYFDLRPDHDLDIMTAGQSPSGITARLLGLLDDLYEADRPDRVIVLGDTTSAMAAAMAAFHRKISVAHVEAGLRTGSRYNPFPEEMNRRLITQLADLHFAATEANRENLLRENVHPGSIHVTGNPVIDALGHILNDPAAIPPRQASEILARRNRIILLTTHRRENFGEAQQAIFAAIGGIVEEHDDVEVVFPVHPNPAVAEAIAEWLPPHPRIHCIEPLDYPAFIRLLSLAHLVLSDSGGLQEEAPALGRPLLVLRTTTERREAVDAGAAILAGVEEEAIMLHARHLLTDADAYAAMAVPRFPFGAGGAAERIVEWLGRV
ncbi:MAG: UDP-N-acetylglucosamine 2-epimerase (non-hydrolyzing) [Candidatus Kapaibacterium sp.]